MFSLFLLARGKTLYSIFFKSLSLSSFGHSAPFFFGTGLALSLDRRSWISLFLLFLLLHSPLWPKKKPSTIKRLDLLGHLGEMPESRLWFLFTSCMEVGRTPCLVIFCWLFSGGNDGTGKGGTYQRKPGSSLMPDRVIGRGFDQGPRENV